MLTGGLHMTAEDRSNDGAAAAGSPPSGLDAIPVAMHVGDEQCPWVDIGDGSLLKVVRVRISEGLWIIKNRFAPGAKVQRHKHTGQVLAFTLSGSWKYDEYPDINTAGSFLYEPAGSIHTLIVPETNTEPTDVWFAIWGANLNLDDDGNVASVFDAQVTLDFYLAMCAAEGVVPGTLIED